MEPPAEPSDVARTPPIDRAWAILPALLPPIHALSSSLTTPDLAYHLRVGEMIRLSGSIPRIDTFTFTVAGTEWIDQQWGGQVVLEAAYRLGGWATLGVVQAAIIGLSFWIVSRAARVAGASARTASLLAIGAYIIAAQNLAMRPQLLALPLVTTACLLIAGRHQHPRRLWVVPVLALMGANVHGSFVLFPLLLGLAWLDDTIQRRQGAGGVLAVTAVSLLATLVNPFGAHLWRYAYELSTNPVIRSTITEWAPTTLDGYAGWLMVGSALFVAIFTARRARSTPWGAIVTLSVFFLMAMASQRAVLWWSVVFPWVVAGLLERVSRPEGRRSSPIPAIAIVATPAIVIVALLPWWRSDAYEDRLRYAPHGITDAASNLPAGSKLLAYQPWGAWFEFTLPDKRLFVDSRIELYPRAIWDDYGAVAEGKAQWRDVLDRWRPDAIAAVDEWDLLPILRDDPAWTVAYEDEDGVLLVRA